MNRDLTFDALKAFLIFLVVLGHFLQFTILDFDDNYLFKLIYSFHMPFFIFLSGYFSFQKDRISISYLKRRFLSLIVPYFSWMIVSFIIIYFQSSDLTLQLIFHYFLYPDNGLWFLWVLFWMHFVFYFSDFFSTKYTLCFLSLFSLFVFILVFVLRINNIFGIKTFTLLLPYFIMGFGVHKYKERTNTIISKGYYQLVFLFLLFLLLAYFWQRNDNLHFNSYFVTSKIIIFCYKFLVATLGIIAFFGLAKQIKNFHNWILYVGKNSMIIYAVNIYYLKVLLPLFKIVEIDSLYYLYAIIFSVLIILISLLFELVIKKNKIATFLFLGNR